MGKIHRLNKNVAELIAAGEVVERPSSIVKELVENSIDADAKRISIEIKNGGITFIRVTDDGSGIMKEDIGKAFIRHATSKVFTVDDLNSIGTMGFRGEALPSVAAMSRVEVMSRTPDDIMGTRYVIEGMEELENIEIGCPVGTTIVVRNLFYNTPARMKFLKKDAVEGNTVEALIEKLAMANPGVSFTFIRDGVCKINTPGDGKLISAIRIICGSEVASSLIEVDNFYDIIKVSGYISKTSYSRPNRMLQHFFINNRFVRSKTCSIALEEAYKTRIMGGRFPVCILKVSMPFNNVDVNVHPAKIEVRFSDEKTVYNGVYSSCKLSLDNDENSHIIKSSTQKPKITTFSLQDFDYSDKQQTIVVPKASPAVVESIPTEYYPVISKRTKSISIDIERNEPELSTQKSKIMLENTSKMDIPNFSVVGEIFKTYIVCQLDDKMVLVDKHAAHERANYRKLKLQINSNNRQLAICGNVVELEAEEYRIIIENLDILDTVGILVEDFGERTVIVREVAMVMDKIPMKTILNDIAHKLKLNNFDLTPTAFDQLLFSISCRCAVMAGDKSSLGELVSLATIALERNSAKHCPHGRPIIVEFTNKEIQKMFGR